MGEFLGGQGASLGLLRRGPEGRLHVEVGSGRVCVVEELQMWGEMCEEWSVGVCEEWSMEGCEEWSVGEA